MAGIVAHKNFEHAVVEVVVGQLQVSVGLERRFAPVVHADDGNFLLVGACVDVERLVAKQPPSE